MKKLARSVRGRGELTLDFIEFPPDQDLRLYALLFDGSLIKVLEDDITKPCMLNSWWWRRKVWW
jgi:hypothetical protein